MKVAVVILFLILIIIALSLWIRSLINKNADLKESVKALKEQRAKHIELERKRHEDMEKIKKSDGSLDIDAANKLMQELSEKRRK